MHVSTLTSIQTSLLLWMLCIGASIFAMDTNLHVIQSDILKKYADVEQMYASDFLLLKPEDVIIFDVRQLSEYTVSHLENAIQVNPKIKTREFIELYHASLKNKTVIFYCSVGVRSSKLAERVQKHLGATANESKIYNLVGGVFDWHNNHHPLVSASGATKFIHPYNKRWAKFIVDEESIRYQVE